MHNTNEHYTMAGDVTHREEVLNRSSTTVQNPPWMDVCLTEESMNYLWDIINHSSHGNARPGLAGNVYKSEYVDDENNWFYENVLQECTEYLYFKEWINYYNVYIKKAEPPPVFALEELWVNYQKQHEFNPPHQHTGLYSFVVFMKIPTHWREQHSLPFADGSRNPQASDFQFILSDPSRGPRVRTVEFPLSPDDNGRMFFFPSWLTHQVFPFYECEEERITLSGNIFIYSAELRKELQRRVKEQDWGTNQETSLNLQGPG